MTGKFRHLHCIFHCRIVLPACPALYCCTADLLYEELWRILGACFFTGAITCYALKVVAASAGAFDAAASSRCRSATTHLRERSSQ